MANYQLLSSSMVLVTVPSSSNLDGSGRKEIRRGTVFRTLNGVVVQYMENLVVGDARIEWKIPRADGSQRGILQSASVGRYGDELTLRTPRYGDITVAFLPGLEAYEEEPFVPVEHGYEITCRLIRLA